MRTCKKCGESKLMEGFRIDRRDRRYWTCRVCENADRRGRRNLERDRIQRRVWYYQRGGKALTQARTRRWREQSGYNGCGDPERKRCLSLVSRAVKDGRLLRGNCEECGSGKTEAHHDDYSKPLDVRWLCQPCHQARHHPFLKEPVHVALREGAL